jgi:hypothetical protein
MTFDVDQVRSRMVVSISACHSMRRPGIRERT